MPFDRPFFCKKKIKKIRKADARQEAEDSYFFIVFFFLGTSVTVGDDADVVDRAAAERLEVLAEPLLRGSPANVGNENRHFVFPWRDKQKQKTQHE